MVKLMNIGRSANEIWCDYYPEGNEPNGYLKVDMTREEIVQRNATPDENSTSISVYAHHAMMRLLELRDVETLPKITSSIWY